MWVSKRKSEKRKTPIKWQELLVNALIDIFVGIILILIQKILG
ncbi:MAG: hypothetical protein PUG66_08040 [Clostridiales bacterium]|nr:hypothetical protein [Clostridiales bacterium]